MEIKARALALALAGGMSWGDGKQKGFTTDCCRCAGWGIFIVSLSRNHVNGETKPVKDLGCSS